MQPPHGVWVAEATVTDIIISKTTGGSTDTPIGLVTGCRELVKIKIDSVSIMTPAPVRRRTLHGNLNVRMICVPFFFADRSHLTHFDCYTCVHNVSDAGRYSCTRAVTEGGMNRTTTHKSQSCILF